MSEPCKCAYKHCVYGGKILESDAYVNVNGKLFHNDCLMERDEIFKAVSFYLQNFNLKENRGTVTRVIQTLVYSKKLSTDFVMFMLTYIKDHGKPLNKPMGLYGYATNATIRNAYYAYKRKQEKPKAPEVKKDVEFSLPKKKIMSEFERIVSNGS